MSLHYSVALSNTGTYKTKILILMENEGAHIFVFTQNTLLTVSFKYYAAKAPNYKKKKRHPISFAVDLSVRPLLSSRNVSDKSHCNI